MLLKDLILNYNDFKVINNTSLNSYEVTKVIPIDNELKDFSNEENTIFIGEIKNIKDLDKLEKILSEFNISNISKNSLALKISLDIIDQKRDIFSDFNFPIIHIPENYNIQDITLNLLNTISKSQSKIIEEHEMINNAFMEMNINQATIEEYLVFLSEIIKEDVIYYGKLDYLTYSSNNLFISIEKIQNIKTINQKEYYVQKIEQNAQLYGYIIVNNKPSNISEKNKLVIEYTSTMILIKIQNQIAIDNSKEIVRSDLIADLCMNNIKSEEEVIFRANLQGWKMDSGLLSVIFDIDKFKHSMLHSNKSIEELEEEKLFIYKLIIKEMNNIPYPSYYYRKSDSIIFLVNIELENNLSALDNFIKTHIKPIHKMFGKKDLSFTLTVGIGTYYENLMETYKSYNEAIEAINISRIFKEVDDISCYKDVLIFKDLMEVMSKKDYHSIYTNLIKNMIKKDEEDKTEYFKTLRSIIKNDWNLKQSSKELFIHYNTIIYRFEKLKELLGMDLNNFYEKLIITLTVMILEVEKHIDFNKGMLKK